MRITIEGLMRKSKEFFKKFRISKNHETRLVFIMGYGRSGTTILRKLLSHSMNLEVHWENSEKVMNYFMINDKKLKFIKNQCKHDALVIKPILNSFEISKYLNEYPNLKVIWMIRNYKDVINSALNKFGKRVANNLKDRIYNNRENVSWISKTMPNYIIKNIKNENLENLNAEDWMALVWWAVNYHLICNNLHNNKRVLLIKYEEFVKNPQSVLEKISIHINTQINMSVSKYIKSSSLGKGKNIVLNEWVEKKCKSIWNKFL